ncbi:hypothetical protein, partial [Mesorhizobium sp. WSM3866]|uniref:hypothetical protein n=2 Tax=Phyllobacteriaceae TaxID=69277 RepID=UPI001FE00C63
NRCPRITEITVRDLAKRVSGNYRNTHRWRIVEADLWDRSYLNLGGPAMITIGGDNNGEIAFGVLQAGLDLSYSPSIVHFTWAGCDEMDEVTDDGHAELLDDGSIEITFTYHNGDEAILKAIRQTSSTCQINQIGVDYQYYYFLMSC